MKKNYYSELSGQFMYSIFYSHSEHRTDRFRTHFHTETELGFMLSGEGEYMLGDKRVTAEPHDLFIVRSDEQHCVPTIVTPELISLNMYLSSYFLWNVCSDYIPPQKIRALINSEIPIDNKLRSKRLTECYERIIRLFEDDSENARFGLRREILNLLTVIAEDIDGEDTADIPSAARFSDIQKAVTFIRQNYSQPIGLDDIAKSAAMSRSYFSGVFKTVTGMSPYSYLITIRIERAVKLLKDTDDTVMSIALACGFTSLTSFNKAFKALVGVPPTELRQTQMNPMH